MTPHKIAMLLTKQTVKIQEASILAGSPKSNEACQKEVAATYDLFIKKIKE